MYFLIVVNIITVIINLIKKMYKKNFKIPVREKPLNIPLI